MYFHIRHILKQFHKFQIANVFSPLSEKKKKSKETKQENHVCSFEERSVFAMKRLHVKFTNISLLFTRCLITFSWFSSCSSVQYLVAF